MLENSDQRMNVTLDPKDSGSAERVKTSLIAGSVMQTSSGMQADTRAFTQMSNEGDVKDYSSD